jgi:amidase
MVGYSELLFWPGVIGMTLLPATVAPIGISAAGLPVGVQIVGPLYGDRATIAVAGLIEHSWGGFVAPPGWD